MSLAQLDADGDAAKLRRLESAWRNSEVTQSDLVARFALASNDPREMIRRWGPKARPLPPRGRRSSTPRARRPSPGAVAPGLFVVDVGHQRPGGELPSTVGPLPFSEMAGG